MVTRNYSSFAAFTIGNIPPIPEEAEGRGIQAFKVVGCHTDSPCLKIAPISKSV